MKTPIQIYAEKIEADYLKGNATEHTYRTVLELLIETLGKGVDASNDPKHIDCGAPAEKPGRKPRLSISR